MLLNSGETIVRREDVVPYRWGDTTGRGTVYLTSARIVIESPQHGFLQSGHTETVLDLPLRDVGNVAVGLVLRRARYIVIELASGSLRLDVVDPPKWREAVSAARASVPPPHARGPVTHTIERHIVKVRCRHCGTLSDEMLSKCASCGAAL
ncbi:MAG: hypothetical protein L3K01_00845 [Thermoplasmata archaeon]|nr:hypothetical protein [Thermoplasmata archaeon]MCI4332268.1 hypothetical protein [Thermoplasmata archaeon]